MTSEMKKTYPLCKLRPPVPRSHRSAWSVPRSPGRGAANNIRYGRISQRVPHRSRTLKRVRCVYYSTRLRIRLADPLRFHALVQTSSTPTLCPSRQSQQTCLTSTTIMINVGPVTCAILPQLVTRTTSKMMALSSVRPIMNL